MKAIIREKAILILAENLNSGLSCLITTVKPNLPVQYMYYLIFTTFMNYVFGSVPENFVDFSCLEPSNAFGTFQKVADAKKRECAAQSSLTESSSK